MAGDATTIARPYAEAVFALARDAGAFQAWTDALAFLAALVDDPVMERTIRDPRLDRESLAGLVLDIGGDRLGGEARNFVRLLVDNDRLGVLPEIAQLYEKLKAESERKTEAVVRTPYELDAEQTRRLAEVLKARLGRDVTIVSEIDPSLIGGLHIRAGDLVIDGSVSGKLQKLAHELGI